MQRFQLGKRERRTVAGCAGNDRIHFLRLRECSMCRHVACCSCHVGVVWLKRPHSAVQPAPSSDDGERGRKIWDETEQRRHRIQCRFGDVRRVPGCVESIPGSFDLSVQAIGLENGLALKRDIDSGVAANTPVWNTVCRYAGHCRNKRLFAC